MRKTQQKIHKNKKIRRREWTLYSNDLKDLFGCEFRIGNERYRIEGWIQSNRINPIYAVRMKDDETFVMSPNEVMHDQVMFLPDPTKVRRKK